MNRIEKAREFRKLIKANLQATRKLIRVDELDEEELLEMIDLYESYEIGKSYQTDDIFKHENKLYKVIQEHTSQEDWIPSELPALYLSMMPENVIPEWKQPTGSHDSYSIGDKVIFEGDVYESTIDNNTWNPADYPQGWKVGVV
ncbi:MAG TPA: carbohydrate-binding protein [Tissierellaceae bacterium]|nr:carbohydrate-binding protein [Tissierellaceae bacterium]